MVALIAPKLEEFQVPKLTELEFVRFNKTLAKTSQTVRLAKEMFALPVLQDFHFKLMELVLFQLKQDLVKKLIASQKSMENALNAIQDFTSSQTTLAHNVIKPDSKKTWT